MGNREVGNNLVKKEDCVQNWQDPMARFFKWNIPPSPPQIVTMEATRCCAHQIDSPCWFGLRINYAVWQEGDWGGNVYIKKWKDFHVAREWVIIIRNENLAYYLLNYLGYFITRHAFTFKIVKCKVTFIF